MKSWKTTLGGAVTALGLSIVAIDPAWAKAGLLIAAVGGFVTSLFARDNNVSSEEAGCDLVSRSTHRPGGLGTDSRIPLAMLCLVPLLFIGCASFTTVQTDISSNDAHGNETRTITTKAASRTLFASDSQLSQFEARQTDQDQSARVGALNQRSESPLRDLVELMREMNAARPTP